MHRESSRTSEIKRLREEINSDRPKNASTKKDSVRHIHVQVAFKQFTISVGWDYAVERIERRANVKENWDVGLSYD